MDSANGKRLVASGAGHGAGRRQPVELKPQSVELPFVCPWSGRGGSTAPGPYVGDGAPVGDGALGRYPRARDALADASSWNRAQGRAWKTGHTGVEVYGLATGPRATPVGLLVASESPSKCAHRGAPSPKGRGRQLWRGASQQVWGKGTPFLPRASPLSTDVSWAVGTPRLSGGPAWPRGDSCSCFTPLKGAGDRRDRAVSPRDRGSRGWPTPSYPGGGAQDYKGVQTATPPSSGQSPTGQAASLNPPTRTAGTKPGEAPDPYPASWGP